MSENRLNPQCLPPSSPLCLWEVITKYKFLPKSEGFYHVYFRDCGACITIGSLGGQRKN